MALRVAHKALRDATARAHDQVDAAFGGFDLADRDSYRAFLKAHADVVLPLEAALDPVAGRIVPDWPERKRGALLREDLAFLRSAGEMLDVPNPQLPDLSSDAAIAGTLYVLEGSRLGGRFLARQLPLGFPRAYLDAHQRADAWQGLLARLDEVLGDPAALQTALAAADAAFAAFARSASNRLEKG
ncbi:MAG: biliverdin-producing heme oxygenase [Sphingomonas sp.]